MAYESWISLVFLVEEGQDTQTIIIGICGASSEEFKKNEMY